MTGHHRSGNDDAHTRRRERILAYLRDHLPGYPFDETIDTAFVDELLDDFPRLDVLDQIKALRWYCDNRPFDDGPKPRLAVRRWLTRAW
jgi:hypothetical protein